MPGLHRDYSNITPFVILNIFKTLTEPVVTLSQKNVALQLQQFAFINFPNFWTSVTFSPMFGPV